MFFDLFFFLNYDSARHSEALLFLLYEKGVQTSERNLFAHWSFSYNHNVLFFICAARFKKFALQRTSKTAKINNTKLGNERVRWFFMKPKEKTDNATYYARCSPYNLNTEAERTFIPRQYKLSQQSDNPNLHFFNLLKFIVVCYNWHTFVIVAIAWIWMNKTTIYTYTYTIFYISRHIYLSAHPN